MITEKRIAKVKVKDGQIIIIHVEKHGEFNEKEITFKSFDRPHEDFDKAMDALATHARTILELPKDWKKDDMRITGVSWSQSDAGVQGAVLTGQVSLGTSDAPFNFNTPHLPFEQYSETGNSPVMPTDVIEALEKLQIQAEAFLEGKRAQADLFVKEAAA